MKNIKQIQKEVRELIKPQMIEGHYDPILINKCVEATLKAIDYAHSSLQFNASLKIGDKVEFNGEKCTIEFFDKTTKLFDLQKDMSNVIYTDVPLNVIKQRSV